MHINNFVFLLKRFISLILKCILVFIIAIYIGIRVLRNVISSNVDEYLPMFLLLVLLIFLFLTLLRYINFLFLYKKNILLHIKKNLRIFLLTLFFGIISGLSPGIVGPDDVNWSIIFGSVILLAIIFSLLIFFIMTYNDIGFPYKGNLLLFIKRNIDNIIISTFFTIAGLIAGRMLK